MPAQSLQLQHISLIHPQNIILKSEPEYDGNSETSFHSVKGSIY
jgi:hypothetical protein